MNKKVLILGEGGREHALQWKLAQSPVLKNVQTAPIDIELSKIRNKFVIVSMDELLANGTVDKLNALGVDAFGPTKAAARLESSKVFSYNFMRRHGIPTFDSQTFKDQPSALKYLNQRGWKNIVIKADGLAKGKGVVVPDSKDEAEEAIRKNLVDKQFGSASEQILMQDRGVGPELSVFALCDGERFVMLPSCRDYKRLLDGNKGPNTGGMGAWGPIHPPEEQEIIDTIMRPTIEGMAEEGNPYKGVLYAGIMLTQDGPKVIEYNARFGDPECQAQMLLLEEDLYPRLWQAAHGELTKEPIKVRPGCAVTVALATPGYPDNPITGQVIHGLDKVPKNVEVFLAAAEHDTKDGRIKTAGGRVLYVSAYAESPHKARALAYGAIGPKGIHFAKMQYRKTIAKI
jgi:phosphoribosylamine--glycine ligase